MTGDRCGLPGWCLYVTEQWAICTRDSPFIHSNNNAAVEAQNYTGKSARAPVKTLVVRSPSMKMLLQHWPVQHSCSIWLQFVPSVKAFLKKNKRISLGFTKNRANSYSTSLRTLLRWDAGNNKPVGQHCTWREEPPQTGFTVYSQYAVYVNMSNTQATHVCLVTIEASVETAFNLPCQARVSPPSPASGVRTGQGARIHTKCEVLLKQWNTSVGTSRQEMIHLLFSCGSFQQTEDGRLRGLSASKPPCSSIETRLVCPYFTYVIIT